MYFAVRATVVSYRHVKRFFIAISDENYNQLLYLESTNRLHLNTPRRKLNTQWISQ